MEEARKRKIVMAVLKIRTVKGKSRATKIEKFETLVRGTTVQEVTAIMYKDTDCHLKKKILSEFKLKGADTFTILDMEIKSEHGFTNYKL